MVAQILVTLLVVEFLAAFFGYLYANAGSTISARDNGETVLGGSIIAMVATGAAGVLWTVWS